VDYKDQTFENVDVPLDGNSFENCTFRDVVFTFGTEALLQIIRGFLEPGDGSDIELNLPAAQ
jgi:hypothetical protein